MVSHPNSIEDKAYWEKWRDHYHALGANTPLHKDGIINPDEYNKALRRVLFVLREPNNSSAKEGDLCEWLRNGPISSTWHQAARWAAGLLFGFPEFPEANDRRGEAFKQVAIMNLKKTAGGSTADLAEVSAFAYRSQQMLINQIHDIRPNIIVACGTFDILTWLLNLDIQLSEIATRPVKYHLDNVESWVVPMGHPASRKRHSETYVMLTKRARELFRQVDADVP